MKAAWYVITYDLQHGQIGTKNSIHPDFCKDLIRLSQRVSSHVDSFSVMKNFVATSRHL